MADPASLIFGKYELIRRLALGGMGEVFLARQTGGITGAERLVILKSLLPELAEQDGFVDQFLDEARVAAKLNHPNVVQMFEAGLWNGVYFIAMEYIRGENLSRIQKQAKARGMPLPLHIIVKIGRDALLGLGHAHAAIDDQTGQPLGVVHRDVSPQNIMVRVDGVTKVVDFGIAKAGNRSSRTATGVLKGKLQFMAPEQVKGEAVDNRTDLFAMGVVLYELLTGQRLFSGDNEIQILKAVLAQPILKPSSVVSGFPPELETVLMKMLEREPDARYSSCEEAADELSAWLAQGSRRVSEVDVAGFIKPLVGDNVDEQSRASGENFMVQLHHTPSRGSQSLPAAQGETSPTVVRQREETRAKKVGVGVGVGAAVVVVAVMVGVVVAVADPNKEATPTTLATSTTTTPREPNEQTPPVKKAPAPAKKLTVKAGRLEIELADPVGASVVVDGKQWPSRVPTLVVLPVGPHAISVVDADGAHDVPLALPAPVVEVTSDPPGASIIVAGSSFGLTPARLTKLNGGATHELTLKRDGYVLKKLLVENLQDGEERSFNVVLEKLGKPGKGPPPKPPATPTPAAVVDNAPGVLAVNTKPQPSKVFLDGDLVGTTPLFMPKVPAGKHVVVLENLGTGAKKTKNIVVSAGQTTKLDEKWD